MNSVPPLLSVVIVNFNTGELIRNCLLSILTQTRNLLMEVFVVDNASADGSAEIVEKEFSQVRLIKNAENLYFTKANNIALRMARGKYLMILNPDTYIKEDAFGEMVRFMDAHPEAGACGPKFLNPDDTLQGIGHRFPTFTYALFELLFINAIFPNNPVRRRRTYQEASGDAPMEIEATGGSCMLVRKEAADAVGLLDEGFLMYFEETDWCLRIRKLGSKIFYLSQAHVYHHHAKSTEKVAASKVENIFHASMLHYHRKHHGLAAYLLLLPLSLAHRLILSLRRRCCK